LEASPLPKLSCVSLAAVDNEAQHFKIERAHQSQEEFEVNGDLSNIAFDGDAKRLPFLLLLDGIVS
jgi:hypothetical protein